ncbi:MAG: hypothetical protein KKC05_04195 [Nanoarchaeota archaeon]|nr:hypothetical protein [Nanoarchaeota archaeon]
MKLFVASMIVSFLFVVSSVSGISANISCGDSVCAGEFKLYTDDWLEATIESQLHLLKIYGITTPTDATIVSNDTLFQVIEGQIKKINETDFYIEYINPAADGEEATINILVVDELSTCEEDCTGKHIIVSCGDDLCNRYVNMNESDSILVLEDGRHIVTLENISDKIELRIDGRTRIVNVGDLTGIKGLDFRVIQIGSENKSIGIMFGDENLETCPVDCTVKSCTETDVGKNFFVKGTTSANNFIGVEENLYFNEKIVEYPDECLEGSEGTVPFLKEWWCENETARSIIYTCPLGCVNETCRSDNSTYCGNGICEEGEVCSEDCGVSNITGEECKVHGQIPNYTQGGDMSSQCCPGLKHLVQKHTYYDNCTYMFDQYGVEYVGICISCGNGICDEEYESTCNCPDDCKANEPPPESEENEPDDVEVITTTVDISSIENEPMRVIILNLESFKQSLSPLYQNKVTADELKMIEAVNALENHREEIESRGIFYWLLWFFGQQREQELADATFLRTQITSLAQSQNSLIDVSSKISDSDIAAKIQNEASKLMLEINRLMAEAQEKETTAGGILG